MGPLFVERMSQLLKGDRREQTGLRNIRFGRLSWKQITEAVSTVWDQEWQTLSTAHGNGARPWQSMWLDTIRTERYENWPN
jgi:hypothetical protein